MKDLIDKALNKIISKVKQKELLTAASYALNPSGKRIRPLLVLATVKAFGKPINKAIDAACALEFIHTYSLIHDDLPCMDDDDFRRGKPSLHKAFPEWLALLTGDFFLNLAFETLASSKLPNAKKMKLISVLSKRGGASGMIGGQVIDMKSKNKKLTQSQQNKLNLNKTASLFIASLEFGCIIADAGEKATKVMHNVGKKIGIAFQIADDIKDNFSADTHRDSKIGKFANPDVADLRLSRKAIFEGNIAAGGDLKGADIGAGKNPIFEVRCVAKERKEILLKSALKELSSLPFIPKQLQKSGIYPSRRPRFSIAETGLYSETNMADAGGRKDWDAGEEKNRFLKLFRYNATMLMNIISGI